MSSCSIDTIKPSAKSHDVSVHHGPSPKAKYNLPPVEKQLHMIGSVERSPIKKQKNELTITLHRVVTDHGIITVHNRNGDSGFVNNIRKVSMGDARVKEKMNTQRLIDQKGYPWMVAVVCIDDDKNNPEGGQKILQDWVRLGNSSLVTRLNKTISNVFLIRSDLTPKEDDFLGNHLIERDTLDIIRDVYVDYSDKNIEANNAIMKAYFGSSQEANNMNMESAADDSVKDEEVTAFLASLDKDN